MYGLNVVVGFRQEKIDILYIIGGVVANILQ